MIQSLSLTGFRNLGFESYPLSPGVNFIYGENGIGKSAFIESLYFLSYGRSFRTSSADNIIGFDAPYSLIKAIIAHEGVEKTVAILRERSKTTVKISGDKATLSQVARLSPALFIDSDTYRDFMTSSVFRRRIFDWIGFHVKPGYLECARRYASLLKNRNAALKAMQDTAPWDHLIVEPAMALTQMRHELYEAFLPYLQLENCDYLSEAMFVFSPGFKSDDSFAKALRSNIIIDQARRKTTAGPHAADWQLVIGGREARHVLSQGQQKTAYFNLVVALDNFLQHHGIRPLLLVDDFSAELDEVNAGRFLDLLESRAGQSVVSAIGAPVCGRGRDVAMFHVEPTS